MNNPIRFVDPYGNYWWVPALELVCEGYNAAVSTASDNYNDKVQESDKRAGEANDALNDLEMRRCIERYQVHKDECLFNKCRKEALRRAKARRDEQQKKYENDRKNNPWDKFPKPPSCTLIAKPPKPR